MDNNLSFVRTEMLQGQTPPLGERGIVRWMRTNLFATPMDTALTLLAILALAWFLPGMINWLFINAVWSGPDRSVCSTVAQGGIQPDGWSGACWAYVNANFNQFMYGPYPMDQHWRVNLVAIMFVVLLVPLLIPKAPYKVPNAIVFFFIFPIVAFILLVGGWFGLPYVETSSWGGLARHADAFLCRHLGIAAAWHCAGTRAPVEDAGDQDALRHLHRNDPRHSADHCPVHG